MSISRFAIAATAGIGLLSGCTVPLKELRHSGGYVGHVMDKRLFDASGSKKLQLLRAVMVIDMAARVGLGTVKDGSEANALVEYLGSATNEVNFLAGHLFGPQPADGLGTNFCQDLRFGEKKDEDCYAHSALFESDLPQLEYKIGRLALAALPRKHAEGFLNSAKSGNFIGAAWKFLRLAGAAADGAHRGAASYRSSQEILALIIQGADEGSLCKGGGAEADIRTVNQAILCLGLSPDDLFANDEIKSFPTEVPHSAFEVLVGNIRNACAMYPVALAVEEGGSDNSGGGQEATTQSAIATQTAQDAENRIKACRGIKFSPKLRFKGLQNYEGKIAGS